MKTLKNRVLSFSLPLSLPLSLRLSLGVSAVLLLTTSISSFAFTPAEIKDAISERSRERHPEANPAFWSNLGPESVAVMESMYKETKSPVLQSTLIEGLSYFNDPEVGSFLENEIPKSDNDVFKKKMLESLITSQGESSFDFVEPYLKDPNGSIRLAVASGMQRSMGNLAKAQSRLKKFNSEETSAWVKSDLEKAAHDDANLQKITDNPLTEKPVALKPLSEKDWAGDWAGVWMSAKKTTKAKINLIYLEKDKTWKVKLSLPKQIPYELKREGVDVLYYTSNHLHWIEVRNKKDDFIFIGQRQ